ncbi:MAG: hypothetical protein EOL88_00735 [Bacteroidia bacterium]|nr:hypothetical protein [Bacteroidia bacterium]
MSEESKYQSDHDLLIRIDTRLSDLIRDNNDFKTRLSKVEVNKCDKEEVGEKIKIQEIAVDTKIKDHENRMRKLERFVYIASGFLLLLQFVLTNANK